MSLTSKLAFQVDRGAQYKGTELFRSGAVKVEMVEPDHFHAVVQGGNVYDVCLQYLNQDLLVSCECPYFRDRGACKHIWATVMEADRRGALPRALAQRHLELLEVDRDDEDDGPVMTRRTSQLRNLTPPPPPAPPPPAWQTELSAIQQQLGAVPPRSSNWPADFQLIYILDRAASFSAGNIVIEVKMRTRKKTGEWSVPKDFRLTVGQIGELPVPEDKDLVTLLVGGVEAFSYGYSSSFPLALRKGLTTPLAHTLLPRLSASGRLFSSPYNATDLHPIEWDEGEPWRLWLELRQDDRDQWKITGWLRRAEERMPVTEPDLLLAGGLMLARRKVARFEHSGGFEWISQLRRIKEISFPDRERDAVLAKLLESPSLPPLDLDEPLRFSERHVTPRPGLRITEKRDWNGTHFEGALLFDYGRGFVDEASASRGLWQPEERVYVVRQPEAETQARTKLLETGLKPEGFGQSWRFVPKALPRVVRDLVHAGWHVEAQGKAFRQPGKTKVEVSSGIDWFDLHAEVDYGGVSASLPQLLAAARRGDTMVQLGDGSFGLLPEDWLARFAPLAGLGTGAGENGEQALRFRRNQAGLLDALLAAQPEVHVDEIFERVRDRLRDFGGIRAAEQPAGFVGELRGYQREGLGWMEFLRDFGFGGCLADDMGVGKTAQVLALLETRRVAGNGASLVVAPKSLMFNWREEAARFTPELRVLEHTGADRDVDRFGEFDLILTTYGTALRDAAQLSEYQFDYVVLDEAQAIKNAATASAKAVRLLRANHRLALSGTPIENHLGELWSLFEFLNPGMLGEARVLKMSGGLARNPGEEARQLLAQALRPFILRRTKRQVARELPEKTEQTVLCELEPEERKQYEDLRRHYRESLLDRVARQGMGRSKMHVLEALLRLRQAACHPGLLDPKMSQKSSAKLDALMERLEEVREEGHKALVFSQFTSLLAIVRQRLDAAGVTYAYLDGATRDRQARVEQFQNDESCGLFLISLKAGGLGLNLTAAEYVFLLDPWWNPAVEAQAVDRAHRIGQTRPVFAYRLIAKGTVEEKVLELQKSKRDLADAIVGQDNSLIRDLKREDLELLLS